MQACLLNISLCIYKHIWLVLFLLVLLYHSFPSTKLVFIDTIKSNSVFPLAQVKNPGVILKPGLLLLFQINPQKILRALPSKYIHCDPFFSPPYIQLGQGHFRHSLGSLFLLSIFHAPTFTSILYDLTADRVIKRSSTPNEIYQYFLISLRIKVNALIMASKALSFRAQFFISNYSLPLSLCPSLSDFFALSRIFQIWICLRVFKVAVSTAENTPHPESHMPHSLSPARNYSGVTFSEVSLAAWFKISPCPCCFNFLSPFPCFMILYSICQLPTNYIINFCAYLLHILYYRILIINMH